MARLDMGAFWGLMGLAYLLGSVPTGLLLARRFAQVDVRERGSGNIGATNVLRVAGKWLGLLTLLGDALKGLVPTILALRWLEHPSQAGWVALAALLGHCFSIFLRGRGGKGVAVAFGTYLALAPLAILIAGGAWLGVVGVTRKSSVGALVAAPILLASIWLLPDYRMYGGSTLLVLGVIVARHRENIRRLRAGQEH